MAERIGRGTQYFARWLDSTPGPLKIMANKKPTRKEEEAYAAFLKKRIDSQNYKNSVSREEYEKTKAKYDKVKLKLRLT